MKNYILDGQLIRFSDKLQEDIISDDTIDSFLLEAAHAAKFTYVAPDKAYTVSEVEDLIHSDQDFATYCLLLAANDGNILPKTKKDGTPAFFVSVAEGVNTYGKMSTKQAEIVMKSGRGLDTYAAEITTLLNNRNTAVQQQSSTFSDDDIDAIFKELFGESL